MKNKKCIFLTPLLTLLLCSFTTPNKYTLYDYNSTESPRLTKFPYNGEVKEVDKDYTTDLGKRNGPIGQFMKWKVTSLKYHDASKNAFILYYKNPMINSKAVSSYTQTISYTVSREYSFSFAKQETHELSLKLATGFSYYGIDISKAMSAKQSTTSIESYTYTYGESQTISEEITFDFSRVPDGCLVSPCVVVSAYEIEFTYTIYDHYWWGDYESRDSSEVNQKNSLVIYNPETAYITYCVKLEGNEEKPIYYLHA